MSIYTPDYTLPVVHFTDLTDKYAFTCFTTTRLGGVSMGGYASPDHIRHSRHIVCEALGVSPQALYIPHQIHGDTVKVIDSDFVTASVDEQLHALDGVDALISSLPDICLGIITADCVPLVFYCPNPAVIAVAHAGWRGTAAEIGRKVVEQMNTLYQCAPQDVHVVIYPCIHKEAYEVGEDVVAAMLGTGVALNEVASPSETPGRFYLDLISVNRQQLLVAGVHSQHIRIQSACTYTHAESFYSARRQGIQSGRMLSGVCMK